MIGKQFSFYIVTIDNNPLATPHVFTDLNAAREKRNELNDCEETFVYVVLHCVGTVLEKEL